MVLVFPSKAEADVKLQELAVTPFGNVILWAANPTPDFAFDGTPNLIQYVQSVDGRCALCHQFSEEDTDWLEAQGVTVLDSLPSDWQYPSSTIG